MSSLVASILPLLERIASAGTVSHAWQAYSDAARAAGFLYALAFFAPMEGQLEANIFADNAPTGWLAEYTRRGCDTSDQYAQRVRVERRPFSWRADTHVCETPGERQWRDLAMDAGMAAGILIPDRSGGGLKAIGLSGRPFELAATDRMALHFAGIETLLRMQELGLKCRAKEMPDLSQRERECLKWAAAGKSDWEIGAILSLSEKTVNAYIERAKHKVGGATRVQAVVIALRNNIITL